MSKNDSDSNLNMLLITAANHFAVSTATMIEVHEGKFKPRLSTEYFSVHGNFYLFIHHPKERCLFFAEPGKQPEYYHSIKAKL